MITKENAITYLKDTDTGIVAFSYYGDEIDLLDNWDEVTHIALQADLTQTAIECLLIAFENESCLLGDLVNGRAGFYTVESLDSHTVEYRKVTDLATLQKMTRGLA